MSKSWFEVEVDFQSPDRENAITWCLNEYGPESVEGDWTILGNYFMFRSEESRTWFILNCKNVVMLT